MNELREWTLLRLTAYIELKDENGESTSTYQFDVTPGSNVEDGVNEQLMKDFNIEGVMK